MTEEISEVIEAPIEPLAPIVEAPISTPETEKIAPEKESQRDKAKNAARDAINQLRGEEKPKADRARDDTGKFATKDTVSAPKVAAPKESPTTENMTKASEIQPSKADITPPVSWAADAKTDWNSASPALKAAVFKREQEVSQGFAQYSEKTRQYESALAPIVQVANQVGATPDYVIQEWAQAHNALNQNAPAAIYSLAEKFGVNLAELVSNPPAPQRMVRNDPAFSQVTHEVNSLKSQLEAIKQERISGFVEEFATKNPHFNDVTDDIQKYISEIRAANPGVPERELLQEAYNRAIWLNPNVREKLISEKSTNIVPVQQKSQQAQRAAVSIRGSSAGSADMPIEKRYKTTHDAARAAIQSLRSNA